MKINVPLEFLTHRQLIAARDLYEAGAIDDQAGAWSHVCAEIADACRVQIAERTISAARHVDPLGYTLLGRLTPPDDHAAPS